MLLLALIALLESPAPPPPNLSGRWTYSVEKSEDAQAKVRQAVQQHRTVSGPVGPSSHHRNAGPIAPSSAPPIPSVFETLTEPPRKLTITETEAEVAIIDSDGRLRQLKADGTPSREGNQDVKASWRNDSFVVESREGGNLTTEVFSLEPGVLTVQVTAASPTLGSVSVKRVYLPSAP
jgi:hypothetical protein